jgi:hypothetical protein
VPLPHQDDPESVSIPAVPKTCLLLGEKFQSEFWKTSVVSAQGDDYILYCHPSRQKTPRSDRLREWYHAVLRRGKELGVVQHVSNLFDTFFEGGKDHRSEKVTIQALPYLEGARAPGRRTDRCAGVSTGMGAD